MTDLRKSSLKPFTNILVKKPYLFSYIHESITNDISEIRYIPIPENIRNHNFLLGFVEFSRSSYFKKLAATTQNSYRTLFETLCDFCEEKPEHSSVEDMGFITPNFKNFLINKDTAENTIFIFVSKAITLFTFLCDPLNEMHKKKWWHPNIFHVKNNIKKIRRPLDNQVKSLADLQGESEYTDEKLLISLRRVSLWLLKELNYIRKVLIEDHKFDISQVLDTYDGKVLNKSNLFNFGRPGSKIEMCSIRCNLLNTAINKIPILAELYFYDRGILLKEAIQNNAFGIEKINEELKCQINGLERYLTSKDIEYPIGRKSYNQKDDGLMHNISYVSSAFKSSKNMTTNTTFPPGVLFCNSIAEEIAFTWFLASERIQGSSIDNLKVEDIVITNKNRRNKPLAYEIVWHKGRGNNEFASPIYKKGEPAFEAIQSYLNNVQSLEISNLKMSRPKYLNQKKINLLYNSVHGIPNSTSLPISLLGLKGSVLQTKCLNEVDQAEPFIELMENILSSNYKKYTQRLKYDRSRHKYIYGETNQSPTRNEFVEPQSLGISLANIAQSRAIMNDSIDDDLNVTSALAAHNPKTHINTYINRSEITKNPESKTYNFAEKVGDEMLEMVKRIAGYKSNIKVIDIHTLKSKLGLSHPEENTKKLPPEEIDKLLIDARNSGYEIGTLGELSINDTTYIIQTPLVAAMIIGFTNHIDSSLELLSSDSERKVKLALIHRAYLNSLLDYFPKKIIGEAKLILENTKFPFPDLL